MVNQDWGMILMDSLKDIWQGIVKFVPDFLAATFIFIAGWFIANLVGQLIAQFVRSLKLDSALRLVQVEQVLKRAGVGLDSGSFIGGLVRWFIVVVALVASLEVLELDQVNVVLQQIVLLYVPHVVGASIIILAAAVISDLMQRIVVGAANAAEISSANFAGKVTHWAIWIFGILMALSQLGIGGQIINTLFTGIVVAIAIALGLSFGLGGQTAAARAIEKVREEIFDRNN